MAYPFTECTHTPLSLSLYIYIYIYEREREKEETNNIQIKYITTNKKNIKFQYIINWEIIIIRQNTEESPGDLRRLAVTQIPFESHQLTLVSEKKKKNSQRSNNNNNPEYILENEMHKILWDFEIQTDHLILTKQPDQTIVNKKKRTCWIMDFAAPANNRVKLKESKKRDKYLYLAS